MPRLPQGSALAVKMILPGQPLMSRVFEAHAQAYGTKVAYHGSPFANWYSILKHGIRNCSGQVRDGDLSVCGEALTLEVMNNVQSLFHH